MAADSVLRVNSDNSRSNIMRLIDLASGNGPSSTDTKRTNFLEASG